MGNFLRRYSLPGLKRWLIITVVGFITIVFGLALIFKAHPVTLTANFIWSVLSYIADNVPPTISGLIAILFGVGVLVLAFFQSNKRILSLVAPDQASLTEALDRYHMEGKGPKILVIGGGTGLSNMLTGLKRYTSNITAVVAVADDGGSSGRLRETMDMVPPGDIRNCIAALAADDEVITQLFQYRFDEDAPEDLQNHSFGNLFLTALVELGGSKNMADAVDQACRILKARGKVLPISNDPMHIVAEFEDGSIVEGESKIPEHGGRIKKLSCSGTKPKILPEVLEAVAEADLIILGPGSLYTSVIPNLLVTELTNALQETLVPKIYVCNVMTQPGETTDYSASEHVQAILDHSSKDLIDCIVVNNAPPAKGQLKKYHADGQHEVKVDIGELKKLGLRVHPTNLLQKGNLVRHNPRRLAKTIMALFSKYNSGVMR